MNKVKVTFTIGCPGSGKSTWAVEQAKHKDTFIVCRDDIRASFKGEYKYSHKNEKLVSKIHRDTLRSYMADGITHIIIADTNLNKFHRDNNVEFIKDTAKELNLEVDIQFKLFDVSYRELINRNKTRGSKYVPEDVIRSMYSNLQEYKGWSKTYKPDVSKKKAIIVDLDGTLADNSQRSPFNLKDIKSDTVVKHIKDLVNLYARSHLIIVMSGRQKGIEEEYEKSSSKWLKDNNVWFDEILMREQGDNRSDDVIKEELFWSIADSYNIELAVDDRDQVVAMWRRIGVPCLQVNYGDF